MAEALTRFIERLHDAFREGDERADEKHAEQATVRLLQQQYQALAAGDFATALGLLADDIEMEIVGPPDLPMSGCWKGLRDVSIALVRNFSMVTDQQPEIQSLTAQGDTVVIVARERGRFIPTGRDYDLHWVQLFQFRDGRVIRFREIVDSAAFLRVAEPVGG